MWQNCVVYNAHTHQTSHHSQSQALAEAAEAQRINNKNFEFHLFRCVCAVCARTHCLYRCTRLKVSEKKKKKIDKTEKYVVNFLTPFFLLRWCIIRVGTRHYLYSSFTATPYYVKWDWSFVHAMRSDGLIICFVCLCIRDQWTSRWCHLCIYCSLIGAAAWNSSTTKRKTAEETNKEE